jgi:hypothetical protein
VSDHPTPQPGDVIFVYSRSIASYASCVIQWWKLPKERRKGVWFSHVAIALNDVVAFEASPIHGAASDVDESSTWSRVPRTVVPTEGHARFSPLFGEPADIEIPANEDNSEEPIPGIGKKRLNEGARLILLPDLLIPARRRVVLRHPKAHELSPAEFDTASAHIALKYGSEYSIERLRTSFEEVFPRIAGALPEPVYTFLKKKAAAPADDFVKLLEEDEEFWKEIDRVLPAGGVGRDFFCSHVVARLLLHAKLLQEQPGDRNIMPSELFDRLIRDGWSDVTQTDYSDRAMSAWEQSDKNNWRIRYYEQIGTIANFRMLHMQKAGIELSEEKLDAAHKYLDDTARRLRGIATLGRLTKLIGSGGTCKGQEGQAFRFTEVMSIKPPSELPPEVDNNSIKNAIDASMFTVRLEPGVLIDDKNTVTVHGYEILTFDVAY